jgi:two-component system phosphate regulon sensor histidine kinase PhoR
MVPLLLLGQVSVGWSLLLSLAIAIAAVGVAIYMLLQNFVFRKLTVIYKIIRKSKISDYQSDLADDQENYTLQAVNQEVAEWARKTNEEVKAMKTLETYRKDFVGNISHELKTPIFNMQGYLHTLLDGALEDESINRKYIKKAAGNLDRLQAIVEDLEAIAKLEADHSLVEYMPFDLRELTDEVIQSLEYICKEHNCSIRYHASNNRSYTVNADRGRIQQVLVNLITNAVKYSKADGGEIVISFYDLDKLVLTEVTDNGICVKQEHLKHLFDRFYRVDSSRSRQLGGSGLGLSIVKHIIESHQQTINVRSTTDIGSTFGFTLEKSR